MERVKRMCVFTTHTPVPAGRDQFSPGVADQFLTASQLEALRASECCNAVLNMTFVGLHLSRYVNGASPRQTARGVALHVPRLSDQRHHQRRARGHLDRPRISAALRPLYPGTGDRTASPCAAPLGSP